MSSVVFVHGTGGRAEVYKRAAAIVRDELLARRPSIKLIECPWGDAVGVILHAGGVSVPTYATARAVSVVSSDDADVAAWQLLYGDPLHELRLLGRQSVASSAVSTGSSRAPQSVDFLGDGDEELAPGQPPPWLALSDAVHGFVPSPMLKAIVEKSGLTPYWDTSYASVTGSRETNDAITAAGQGLADQRLAVARAVVATAIVAAADNQDAIPDGALRDEMVMHVVAGLGGQERGVSSWLMDQATGFAEHLASGYLTRKRGAITDAAFPAAGDILLYQLRGDLLRDFIESRIAEAAGPVTLLAHSLGGIACFDLLAMKPIAKVQRLITVGSQAPFLYEIDALKGLRYGEPLPPWFPAWLNIYDRRDVLSYIVEGLPQFTQRSQETRDVAVDSRHPFPHSHSAYWTNPDAWKAIVSALP